MKLMIDIETLSTRPDAAIVAIGAVAFDKTGISDTFEIHMAPETWCGHIDPDTVAWWMTQSQEAQKATFGAAKELQKNHLAAVLSLQTFINKHKPEEVWANDPSFDIVILREWWTRAESPFRFPISYKIERSYRTIMAIAKNLGVDAAKIYQSALAHSAIEDAAAQARAVIFAQDMLKAAW